MTNKKSNKALRAALVLCVLALFCAAFVGATFAKYVTADDAADTARAAKWGVSVSMGGTLFGADYAANNAGTNADTIIFATSQNVSSSEPATWDIVAPGTKSDKGVIITIDGKPEVAYDITTAYADIEDIYLAEGYWGAMVKVYDVTEDNFVDDKYYTLDGDDFTVVADVAAYNLLPADTQLYELRDDVQVGADGYYPIVWTLDYETKVGAATADETETFTSLEALMTFLDANVKALDGNVDTPNNVNANVEIKAKYTITWDWAYEIVGTDEEKAAANKKDTVIGNLIENVLDEDQNLEMVPVYSADDAAWSVASDDLNAVDGDDELCNLDINFNYAITITQVN